MFSKIGMKAFLFFTLLLVVKMVSASDPYEPTSKLQQTLRANDYFDNNLKSITYYYGEMVTLHFDDGTKTNVGLVPRWQKENIDEVECATSSYEIYFVSEPTGYGFFTRKDLDLLRDSGPVGRSFLDVATRLEFIKDPETRKVFPTTINQKTAPNFCYAHNQAKRRWEQCFPFCGLI